MSFRITLSEVDATSGPSFSAQVDQAGAAAEASGGDVVLDFTEVTHFGSTGITVLCRMQTDRPDRRILVENASPMVRRVFEVTGLTQFLAD